MQKALTDQQGHECHFQVAEHRRTLPRDTVRPSSWESAKENTESLERFMTINLISQTAMILGLLGSSVPLKLG